MGKENKSRYAILGMLSLGPMSGYDIKKTIEISTGNFWSESYGQVYPILKQVTEEGLALCHTTKQDGKPERYVYTLTDEGWRQLRQWLTEPIEYQVGRNELLLKLFFGRHSAVSVNIDHVRQFRTLQVQLLEKYRTLEAHVQGKPARSTDPPSSDTGKVYSLVTLSYGRHQCQALLTWCDETLLILSGLVETDTGVSSGDGTKKGEEDELAVERKL